MAAEKVVYECKSCGGTVTLKEKPAKAPECCGQAMTEKKKRSCGCGGRKKKA